MYTILKTDFAGNTGDNLILESLKDLIISIKGKTNFLEIDRNVDLSDRISLINKTKCILMPGFAIRDPLYPQIYTLTKNLYSIKVPLIPIGAGWKGFPGDFKTVNETRYSERTVSFLKHISKKIEKFYCRENYTCKVLQNNGIDNTLMVGDCAWYNSNKLRKRVNPNKEVKNIVFTTPHMAIFKHQSLSILKFLESFFPNATKYLCLQGGKNYPTDLDKYLSYMGKKMGFIIKDVSGTCKKIKFYENCDLHIGYRVHGHLAFLRNRIPSILINEDGRGIGFSKTLDHAGFDGFKRSNNLIFNLINNKSLTKFSKIGFVDMSISKTIEKFLVSELNNKFNSYNKVFEFIDYIYEQRMKPAIQSIP